jgi:hypothetical protein
MRKLGVCLLLLLPAQDSSAQGFGGLKNLAGQGAKLQRVFPAALTLTHQRFRLVTEGRPPGKPGGTPGIAAERIYVGLAAEMQRGGRFRIDPQNADLELHLTVTAFSLTPAASQGACYNGSIEADYVLTRARSGARVDATKLEDRVASSSSGGVSRLPGLLNRNPSGVAKGAEGCLTGEAATERLINALIAGTLRRLTPPPEGSVSAPLPAGELQSLSALAKRGEWTTLAEKAKTSHFADAKTEASRVYLVGLADEALGYEQLRSAAQQEAAEGANMAGGRTEVSAAEREFLGRAKARLTSSLNEYEEALRGDPQERTFVEAKDRVARALPMFVALEPDQEKSRQ